MVTLAALRALIDEVDRNIVDLVKKRGEIVRQIGLLKKKEGLPIFDPLREKEQLEKFRKLALEQGLDPTKVIELFLLLIEQAKDDQQSL